MWRWMNRKMEHDLHEELDRELLLRDIQVAFRRWRTAQLQFDYASGQEEIDYAIFMLKATEARLSVLLGQAKRVGLVVHDYSYLNQPRRGSGT